jgi:hypothetical protein
VFQLFPTKQNFTDLYVGREYLVNTWKIFFFLPESQKMNNLQEFYKLASPESATRIQAAQALSEALIPPTALSECTPDQTYAFSRLTKGLASGRESARLGFTLALAEVSFHPHLTK